MKKRFIVCPVCSSTDIYYEAGMITGEKYKCNHCGYIGSFIIEMDEEEYLKLIDAKKESK